jgi:alpha-amylase
MTDSEYAGFSKITINIGIATKLEACFNNGRGVWDSNNGRTYNFEIGTSTYYPFHDGRSHGKIERSLPK